MKNSMGKSYRIISIEASSLIRVNRNYIIKKEDIEKCYKQFTNILDWSLDTEEIEHLYKRKPKNIRDEIFFKDENFNDYTLSIVQVNFSTRYKEYIEDKPTGIEIDTKELRKEIYEKGFCLENRKYVRYKRSSGSSREGSCLFILEELYDKMNKWSNCGITYKEKDKKHDLASWEAYRALSLSAIVGIIDIPLDSILFLKDYKTKIKEEVVLVRKVGEDLVSKIETVDIENNIWDGEALLDESVFLKGNRGVDISNKSMLLLRNRFFKTCGFRTKLQQYFKDNNIDNIDTLIERSGGFTLAKSVEDILMVTTESSFKYCKFSNGLSLNTIKKWAKNATSKFGIVKYDKRTRYLNGELVQSSYQLLNTIDLKREDAKKIVEPTKNYIEIIRKDMDVLAYHLSKMNEGEESPYVKLNDKTKIDTRNEITLNLLSKNIDFSSTDIFYDFRNQMVRDLKEKVYTGNILLHGTNATLFGNGTELLKASIGAFNGKGALKKGEISCSSFKDGEELLSSRSPHITMGNLLYSKNRLEFDLSKYFVLSPYIVCVDAIKENIQHRLNGCDYDSDSVLITNNKLLKDKVKEKYNDFYVPVYLNDEKIIKQNLSLYELDHIISVNSIGEIVNLSQVLNSLYWEEENKEERIELYKDICKLAVLSGIEIDRAKRDSGLKAKSILHKIREKYKDKIKEYPLFFKYIENEYGDKNNSKGKYREYNCPMEYIYLAGKDIDFKKGKSKNVEHLNLISLFNGFNKHSYNDLIKFKNLIETIKEDLKDIDNMNKAMAKEKSDSSKKTVIGENIRNLKSKIINLFEKNWKTTGFNKLMIEEIVNKKTGLNVHLLFEFLFQSNNVILFDNLIEKCSDTNLERSEEGEIILYDCAFKKVHKM